MNTALPPPSLPSFLPCFANNGRAHLSYFREVCEGSNKFQDTVANMTMVVNVPNFCVLFCSVISTANVAPRCAMLMEEQSES